MSTPVKWIRAYHWLNLDMTAGEGEEGPWAVGEERSVEGDLILCKRGYHSARSWLDALRYAAGPIACVVEVSEPEARDNEKQVSRSRRLVAAADATSTLRLFAADCAERALLRERERGHEPDARSWQAIEAVRGYVAGTVTPDALNGARQAAVGAAAAYAGYGGAYAGYAAAAAYAAYAAAAAAYAPAAYAYAPAYGALAEAARKEEVEWQHRQLAELLDALVDNQSERNGSLPFEANKR